MLNYSVVSIKNSITTRLLMMVFSTYLVITTLLTGFHMSTEYYETKDTIIRDITSFQEMFGSVLSQSVWNGDEKNLQTLVTALQRVSFLTGITVQADMIADITAGIVGNSSQTSLSNNIDKQETVYYQKKQHPNKIIDRFFSEAFSYRFPLIYQDTKGKIEIGSVTLHSNTNIVYQRVKLDFLLIIVSALIKSLALWFIFLLFARVYLNRPLSILSNAITRLNLDNLSDFNLDIKTSGRNELKIIEEGFHFMVDNLKKARDKWLDINQHLEQIVQKRTNELEQNTIDLQHALTEKKHLNTELEKHQNRLQEAYDTLEDQVEDRTRELNQSLIELKQTQDHMIQSEKMASLGSLVAGVAHEINTPLGIGVTEASFLKDITKECHSAFKSDALTQATFEKYMDNALNSSASILKNLTRAGNIIKSFKDVAVDQMLEEKRLFNVKQYINEVLSSLQSQLKRTKHSVVVHCPEEMQIFSYPGVFAQIITNFIMNSLLHGFEGIEQGTIVLDVSISSNNLVFSYRDTGRGMDEKTAISVFEPFFTTKRGKGGTGLGLHIVFNLVTQTLNGKIICNSIPGHETEFIIEMPYEDQPPLLRT
ncbi:MAG: hypothetical protein HOD92_14445 [Deltaproteobacteria bacterium]|jgi:signal transduction histidine kinase|nr:hypothetical protein [Deltaproteobacteria bacterium]MBT4527210.1 hypothetical protein [Deltaproteobacteria bacterium]